MPSTLTVGILSFATLVFTQSVPNGVIPMGFPCSPGSQCEQGSKCYPLPQFYACLPIPPARFEPPGLFGKCNAKYGCKFGFRCASDICLPDRRRPRSCSVTGPSWQNYCGTFRSEHSTCVGGKCVYGLPGGECRTAYIERRCLPGLRCLGVEPAGRANAPGRCTRIGAGDRCLFGAECPPGLRCGSSKKCVAITSGQPCRSSFQCSLDQKCINGRCQRSLLNQIPTTGRARACNTELDCPIAVENVVLDTRCLNGVCVPLRLGWRCTDDDRCGPTLGCRAGICKPNVLGSPCKNFVGACYSGLTCEFWRSKRCIVKSLGQECSTFRDCENGMLCRAGRCQLGRPGDYCVEHDHCGTGTYCIKNTCKTPIAAFG